MTISGGGRTTVFEVASGVTATLSNLTISRGLSHGAGGGVANGGAVTFTGCTISGNSANDGGGVANTGTATLTDCTISGNSGTNGGGGLWNNGTPAELSLTACTISGNSSRSIGGAVQ